MGEFVFINNHFISIDISRGFIPSSIKSHDFAITFNVVKEYPDMFKVLLFKEPKVIFKNNKTANRRKNPDSSFLPSYSSLRRTKTLITDIVLCNDFQYFCTFTFDPDKVDRYSYSACLHKMMQVYSIPIFLLSLKLNTNESNFSFHLFILAPPCVTVLLYFESFV